MGLHGEILTDGTKLEVGTAEDPSGEKFVMLRITEDDLSIVVPMRTPVADKIGKALLESGSGIHLASPAEMPEDGLVVVP